MPSVSGVGEFTNFLNRLDFRPQLPMERIAHPDTDDDAPKEAKNSAFSDKPNMAARLEN
ncbi:uncharacterized protein RSE6_09967 [Rhynchosporium secalis]|uniref:Uncharacterized protein n=1 Tax=Rhynchosporium secalis TaxID=38038 RepID=A0A1E1MJC0_RHYSE|nr:uncharacterized protein RSE6_09967 [Rhynchosporium secalis]